MAQKYKIHCMKKKLGRNPRSDRDLSKKEIKVQIEKGNKSPNGKGKIKVQIKYGK